MNVQELKKVLDYEHSFRFTIIRDPVTQFISNILFFKLMIDNEPIKQVIENFKNKKYWNKLGNVKRKVFSVKYRNNYAKDLGIINDNIFTNLTKRQIIDRFITEKFDKIFHFVGLLEHYKETMIILKDKLNLRLVDVLYLKTNSRKTKNFPLKDEDKKLILKFNKFDAIFYKYYQERFSEILMKIDNEYMRREVEKLSILNAFLPYHCLSILLKNEDKIYEMIKQFFLPKFCKFPKWELYCINNSKAAFGEYIRPVSHMLSSVKHWDGSRLIRHKKPVKLFFFRTHKTGSSTLVHSLIQLAHHYGSTIAVASLNYMQNDPLKRNQQNIGYPHKFKSEMVEPLTNNKSIKYDFFIFHNILDVEELKKILDYEDSFRFTIVRDPVTQFISNIMFFRLVSKTNQPIEESIKMFESKKYWKRLTNSQRKVFSVKYRNNYAKDLGILDDDIFKNLTNLDIIENFMKNKLDKIFHFVGLMEYYEETMIILKDKLNLKLVDVLYVKTRVSQRKKYILNHNDEQIILKYNRFDAMFYEYYKSKFLETLHQINEDYMKNEVEKLSILNSFLPFHCLSTLIKNEGEIYKIVKGFFMKKFCKYSKFTAYCQNNPIEKFDQNIESFIYKQNFKTNISTENTERISFIDQNTLNIMKLYIEQENVLYLAFLTSIIKKNNMKKEMEDLINVYDTERCIITFSTPSNQIMSIYSYNKQIMINRKNFH
ncbi:hypothetical protein SNEBB_008175 [Seison nebaliae]|nr:hypothetical protein SNEBB_008175 [Seison nebaliae]